MTRQRRIFGVSRRRGSMIIEAVIAVTLLATAMIALGRLASNAAAVSQQADNRLAATLAAENAIQRLKSLPYESLPAESASVAESIEESSGCGVTIRVEPFRAAERDALHLSVQVEHDDLVSVTLHDWRFGPSNSDQPPPVDDATDPDGGDDDA